MDLSNLKPAPGSVRQKKRLGRGPGSGLGKTSGRGHKGRGSRSGGNTPPGYEGGQMPLQRRLPKRGFNNPLHTQYAVVNLGQLEKHFASNDVSDVEALRAKGLVRPNAPLVKILADGEVSKALTVKAHKFSAAARAQLEAAGGAVEVLVGA
jgi:large subunit ribosomal protein L15